MQENIKTVLVKKTARNEFKTANIVQYDVGHILSFEGFDLPEAFEVHFCLTETGDAVTQVGNNNQVAVPDILVQDGRWLYAWLYISDEETGLTKFTIQIPVTRRAKPTDQVPSPVEQSEIQQAIAALNTGVAKAETAAENAEQSEGNASQYAENAYNSSEAAANAAESAEGDARTATEKAQIAVNAAETATRKAQNASDSAQTASQKASDASGFAHDAQGAAQSASTSAQSAQGYAQTAGQKATEATQSASNAAQKAQEALSSAQAAEGSANDADTAKRGAETAKEAAQGYAGNASIAAQTAGTAKDTAVQKAGEASQSATNAAQSAQAAEQTAQQFAQDITQLKSDIESKQDAPATPGTEGQVLSLDANGEPVWVNVQTESEIDDTAGEGDTDKAWSADKLVTELQDKADVIINTASGAIASFPDGAAAPVEKLVVNVEPVQNLNGYDHPWSAGGGKNLLKNTAQSITKDGISFIVNDDGSVLVNGTATDNTELVLTTNAIDVPGDYIVNGCPDGGNRRYWMNFKRTVNGTSDWKQEYGSGFTVTDGTIQNVGVFVQRDATLNNVLFKPMIRLASESDATYAPYSNICPITGWTGANVTRTGVNVWDEEWEVGGIKTADGSTVASGAVRSKNFNAIVPSTTYFIKSPDQKTVFVFFYDGSKNYISYVSTLNATFKTPSNARFFKIQVTGAYGTTYNHDISINYPSTDADYHPGHVQNYSISFPLSAGTVYGGELTVNADGSGSLVVDRASVDLGTLGWVFMNVNGTQRLCSVSLNPLPLTPKSDYYFPEIICSAYKVERVSQLPNEPYCVSMGFSGYGYGNRLIVNDEAITTVEQATEKLSGQTCVYKLLVPITYTLSASQIRTLLGTNNVWSDAGDVEVTYRADTKLYIDNKLAELVAQIVNS